MVKKVLLTLALSLFLLPSLVMGQQSSVTVTDHNGYPTKVFTTPTVNSDFKVLVDQCQSMVVEQLPNLGQVQVTCKYVPIPPPSTCTGFGCPLPCVFNCGTPTPPPGGGSGGTTYPNDLVWPVVGNSRNPIDGMGQYETRTLYFTPTVSKYIQGYSSAYSSQINWKWVLKNPAGDNLKTVYGTTPLINFQIPPYSNQKQYHLEVTPMNPDGSWSCNRLPCDLVIDIQ
jgi:hypothetical protein